MLMFKKMQAIIQLGTSQEGLEANWKVTWSKNLDCA